MRERKSVFLLIMTMTTICLIIAGITITILYRTAIEEERARLFETAQSQARLIESTARFNAIYSKNYPGGPISATLKQVIDAHDHETAVGKTEIVLSKKDGENIVFLLRHRHKDHSKPEPVPFESKLAEPMRRALSGQSGSIIGIDYDGQKVLAAYEPLQELNLGMVTKIDMSEIRAPFVKSGLIVVFCTVLMVSIGTGFFFQFTNPLIRQLEKRAFELKQLNQEMKAEINERKRLEKSLLNSEQELSIRNKISDAFLIFSDDNVYSEVLNVVMEVTESNKGFFGYIAESGDLVCPSMTKDIWAKCMIPDKMIVFPRDSWGGLWGKSLLEKKTLYSNDPLSVPEGHIPLDRALAVPIIFRDELIGQIVVANKEVDYTQKDRKQIESIVDAMAPILKARLQRDDIENRRSQVEKALQDAHAELELKVKSRTADLTKTNKKLRLEIEDRKQAEELLKKSEEQYRILVKTLPAVVYKGYKDWGVEFIDNNIEVLTGYTSDKFNSGGSKWSDIIVEEDLETARESFMQALKTEKVFTREYRIHLNSGEISWIQDRGYIVCDNAGEVEYVSGVFFDITDRKREALEHEKTKDLLQTVFDGVPDPLVLLDKRLEVRLLNDAAMRYYQIKKSEDVTGICCFESLMGKSAPCEGCQVPAVVASRKSGSFERKGVMNPNKLEQVTIYRFHEDIHNFGGALMYIRDITESRLLEHKMIHNEKLALMGLTLSCITHEIANPISAITFNTPILEDYISAMISVADNHIKNLEDVELFHMSYPQFKEDAFKIVENILHASHRLNSTVSNLRKLYGPKKSQKPRWVDLKKLLDRITAATAVEIREKVKYFEINIPENPPQIHTDPDALEQILTNLVINAAQAADKEDSKVTLDVTQGDTWKEHLIIELSDNGCGMDQETVSKIFTPFFTTKAPGQGTGLGLYVCQDLAKDIGGRIEVQSEPGSGSVFKVILSDRERRAAKRL